MLSFASDATAAPWNDVVLAGGWSPSIQMLKDFSGAERESKAK